jgi:hypothetical protein
MLTIQGVKYLSTKYLKYICATLFTIEFKFILIIA